MSLARILAILAVAIASLAAIALLPHGELIQAIAALPLVGALVAAIFEIVRDQARRQHEVGLADSQHRFALAAGSHMASAAFDHHVAFCEEYVAEALAALRTLFREGPTREALQHSDRIHAIKQKHVLWITRDLESQLEPFEKALRKIGANELVAAKFPHSDGHQKRTTEMFKQFAEVLGTEHMGSEWDGEEITDSAAIGRVVSHLRDMLGVEELTTLRNAIIRQALTAVK